MKPSTLKGRKVNQRVLRQGKRWRGQTMIIHYTFGAPATAQESKESTVYVGSFASLRLHKHAVKRNRMRRRCKEAVRLALAPVQKIATVQLLISPKPSSLDSDYSLLFKDAQSFIQFLVEHDPSTT